MLSIFVYLKIYQKFGVSKMLKCFCSSRLHLFDKKTVKTAILWNIIDISNNCFLFEYILNSNLFLWSKLYFQNHYSSLQCHMISEIILICWFAAQKHFWLLSMLKTVVLPNIFEKTETNFIFQDFWMNIKFKRTTFIWNINLLLHYKCLYCHFWSI